MWSILQQISLLQQSCLSRKDKYMWLEEQDFAAIINLSGASYIHICMFNIDRVVRQRASPAVQHHLLTEVWNGFAAIPAVGIRWSIVHVKRIYVLRKNRRNKCVCHFFQRWSYISNDNLCDLYKCYDLARYIQRDRWLARLHQARDAQIFTRPFDPD